MKVSRAKTAAAVSGELPWLDWLRFASALCVVAAHARAAQFADFSSLDAQSRTGLVAGFFALTRLGHEAVIVFFVLSGYLVGGRAQERLKTGRFDLSGYAIDRVTRILVPLVPAVVLTCAVQAWVGELDPAGVIVGNIIGVQGLLTPVMSLNGPLWSLSYEMWFYVLCGSVVVFAMTPRLGSFAAIAISFGVFTVLEAHLLLCWVLGVLAFLWKPARGTKALLAIGVCVTLLGVAGRQFASEGAMQAAFAITPSADFWTVVLAFGMALTVASVISLRTPASGVFGWLYRRGGTLAAFSYTLYLVHYPVIYFLVQDGVRSVTVDGSGVLAFLLLIFASLVVSYILYLAFERQTSRVRKFLRAPRARA